MQPKKNERFRATNVTKIFILLGILSDYHQNSHGTPIYSSLEPLTDANAYQQTSEWDNPFVHLPTKLISLRHSRFYLYSHRRYPFTSTSTANKYDELSLSKSKHFTRENNNFPKNVSKSNNSHFSLTNEIMQHDKNVIHENTLPVIQPKADLYFHTVPSTSAIMLLTTAASTIANNSHTTKILDTGQPFDHAKNSTTTREIKQKPNTIKNMESPTRRKSRRSYQTMNNNTIAFRQPNSPNASKEKILSPKILSPKKSSQLYRSSGHSPKSVRAMNFYGSLPPPSSTSTTAIAQWTEENSWSSAAQRFFQPLPLTLPSVEFNLSFHLSSSPLPINLETTKKSDFNRFKNFSSYDALTFITPPNIESQVQSKELTIANFLKKSIMSIENKGNIIINYKGLSSQGPFMNYSMEENSSELEYDDDDITVERDSLELITTTVPSYDEDSQGDFSQTNHSSNYNSTLSSTIVERSELNFPFTTEQGSYAYSSSVRPPSDSESERAALIRNFEMRHPVKAWAAVGLYDHEYLKLINSHWLQFEPADPIVHKILGILYGVIMVIGCGGNLCVIVMFIRCRSLRTPPNYLIVNLAVSDFLMMAKMPVFIFNSMYGGPVLGDLGCRIYGFVGGLTGVASIMTLAAIAIDRYFVIVYPLNPMKRTTSARAILMLTAVWIYSGLFSSLPLFGVNAYVSEGYLTSCSFDYLSEKLSDRIFVGVFFIAAWVFPLGIIVYSYAKIFQIVQSAARMEFFHPNMGSGGGGTSGTQKAQGSIKHQKKQKAEVKIAILSSVIILIWSLAWSPYAIVALLGIFGFKGYITPLASSIPALFCKTASCVDPFLYAINHPRFQRELRNKFSICYRLKKKKRRSCQEASYYSNTMKGQSENSDDIEIVRSSTKRKVRISPPRTRSSPPTPDSIKARAQSLNSTGLGLIEPAGCKDTHCITFTLKENDGVRFSKISSSEKPFEISDKNTSTVIYSIATSGINTTTTSTSIITTQNSENYSSSVNGHKDKSNENETGLQGTSNKKEVRNGILIIKGHKRNSLKYISSRLNKDEIIFENDNNKATNETKENVKTCTQQNPSPGESDCDTIKKEKANILAELPDFSKNHSAYGSLRLNSLDSAGSCNLTGEKNLGSFHTSNTDIHNQTKLIKLETTIM